MADGMECSGSIDFKGLIFGFSSAALFYMGETELEDKESSGVNMPLAKQNIDIICLLKDKTKGNLSEEEEKLVCSILSDLQMKYVKATKAE